MSKSPFSCGLRTGQRCFSLRSHFNARHPIKQMAGPNIVCQIFFAADEYTLSLDDCQALDSLVSYYRQRLAEGNQVSLSCVGRADETFTSKHNQKLSQNRADVVTGYIKLKMGLMQVNFEVKSGDLGGHFATGERYSGSERARDRRVDIYEWRKVPKPPTKSTIKATRVPIQWVVKTIEMKPGHMHGDTRSVKTVVVVVEEYKDVPADFVIAKTDVRELYNKVTMLPTTSTVIERHKVFYQKKHSSQTVVKGVEYAAMIAKLIKFGGNDLKNERVYKSWGDYHLHSNNPQMEKIRQEYLRSRNVTKH